MPKLLNQRRLNKVQYISMSDYIRSMDALDDFEDKMAFTTRYLIAHGGREERDVSLAEAIHIAKFKLADASRDARRMRIMNPDQAVNPELSDEEDAPNRQFMIEPIEYLKNEVDNLIRVEAGSMDNSLESQQRMANYQLMSAVLLNDNDHSLSYEIDELDVEPHVRDFNARFKAIYGGDKQLEKAYDKTKPGVLSKMFGTSSVAARNLDEVYKAFNNEEHALYGDMRALDKAATEYLQHVFPQWDPKTGPIHDSDLSRLSGTQKNRAEFSLNILKTTTQIRLTEPIYETIMTSNIQARAEEEARKSSEIIEFSEENKNDFQEDLSKDLAEEENNIEDIEVEDEEASKDYHANFVDVDDDELEP